jgi:hypothetical protein
MGGKQEFYKEVIKWHEDNYGACVWETYENEISDKFRVQGVFIIQYLYDVLLYKTG